MKFSLMFAMLASLASGCLLTVESGWRHGTGWGAALTMSALATVGALTCWNTLAELLSLWVWARWVVLGASLISPLAFAARRVVEDEELQPIIAWITGAVCLAVLLSVFPNTVDGAMASFSDMISAIQGTDYDAVRAVAEPPAPASSATPAVR